MVHTTSPPPPPHTHTSTENDRHGPLLPPSGCFHIIINLSRPLLWVISTVRSIYRGMAGIAYFKVSIHSSLLLYDKARTLHLPNSRPIRRKNYNNLRMANIIHLKQYLYIWRQHHDNNRTLSSVWFHNFTIKQFCCQSSNRCPVHLSLSREHYDRARKNMESQIILWWLNELHIWKLKKYICGML